MSNRNFILTTILIIVFFFSSLSWAHEGHDKAPGESNESVGPVTITEQAKQNLNLKVDQASIRTVDKNITLIGQVEAIPSRLAAVTSRISGRVTSLYINEGQQVKKGQELVEVESRQPGEPPPRVKYLAPIDGIMMEQHAVIGDTVQPDKHLMEVADLHEIYVEGRIYEGQVPSIKLGQKTRVFVESYPSEIFEGKVELLGGSLDSETRTLKMWVRVNNPNQNLRPNMRATLHVISGESDPVITVPKGAILGEMGHYFVFVQSEEDSLTFERRNIVIGDSDDLYVEVIEGVFPGDKIVTAGNYQLQYVPSSPKKEEHQEKEDRHIAKSGMQISIVQIMIGFVIGFMLCLVLSNLLKRGSY